MLIASNTSPISNLAIIGRLGLLRSQFREIWIPRAVRSELDQLSHSAALKEIQQALQEGWIKMQALRDDKVARLLTVVLDPGGAEAIALALELSADLILLDERDGRSTAQAAGLRVTGVRWSVASRQERWRDQIAEARDRRIAHRSRFFLSSRFEEQALAKAGE